MAQEKSKEKEQTTSSQPFPIRLFKMLEESPKRGFEDVISWQQEGESFRVYKPDRFAEEIASDFFALRKYKSFLRQLNIYGFQRIHHGANKGGYFHPLFKRDKPEACALISRQGETQRTSVAASGIAEKSKPSESSEGEYDPQSSLVANHLQQRLPEEVDASLLDPVQLLFSLGSATRSRQLNRTLLRDNTSRAVASANNEMNGQSSTSAFQMNKEQEHSFPWKLHTLLEDSERKGFTDIVSWVEDGNAFKVHDSDAFVSRLMPNFFDQSKYESFRRQLNLYGFSRVTRGVKKGYISHPFFRKNDRKLCRNITRKGKEDITAKASIPNISTTAI